MTLEDGEHIYSSSGRAAWKKPADIACTIFIYILIAYVVASWIPGLGPVREILGKIMDPVLNPLRKIIPSLGVGKGVGVDFSPLIVYFGLSWVQRRFLKR